MKKKILTIVIVVLLVASVMGAIGIYFIYNNQYIKFQDETIQKVILETLNEKENKILKGKEKEIEIVYVNELLSDISTLEDLEMFPKLSEVSFMWEANYETEEERINFEERWKVTKEEYERYQEMLRETLPELKELKKLQMGSYNIFYDLNAFRDCSQIEELRIRKNQITNIDGLKEMKKLKILDLSYNKFKDISILEELESLEAININKTPINNLEVLLECPSLKLVCYVAKNETEESILKMLEEKGIIIVQKEWEFVDQLEQLKIKNRG